MRLTQRLNPPVHGNQREFARTNKIWIVIFLLASFITIDASSQQNSLPFNGFDQFVSFSNLSVFDNSQRDFTVEIWFQSDSTNQDQAIFSVGPNSPGQGFVLKKNNTNFLEILTGDGTLITSSLDINDTLWHHAAVVYQDSVFSMYLDGSFQSNANYNIALDGTLAELARSTFSGTEYFAGEMDQLKIWGRALTREEIISGIFEEGVGYGFLSFNYYDFNQFSSSELSDQINGENGFLINMSGTEWTGSSALTPFVIFSNGTGPFSSAGTWLNGIVPRLIHSIEINGTDSVYLDSDVDVSAVTVQSMAAFDQTGFNILMLKGLELFGNHYSNANDTIFLFGNESNLDGGGNELPSLFFADGSLINLSQPMTTKGGVFIDSTGTFNSFGYNTTLIDSASWESYGSYNLTGDTVKFNGNYHTIFGGNFESIAIDTGTVVLQDSLIVNTSITATGTGTIDMGTNVIVPGYSADLIQLDTIVWSTGARFVIDQYMSSFQSSYFLFGPEDFVFPTIEIVQDGVLDLLTTIADLPIGPNESLIINGGEFYGGDGQGIFLDDNASVQINSGTFEINSDGTILFGAGAQILNNGGQLKIGSPYDPGTTFSVTVQSTSTTAGDLQITQTSGDMAIDFTDFSDLSGDGIRIDGGTVSRPFNTSSFFNGIGNSYITINSNALDDQGMDSVAFFTGPLKNIIKTSSSGSGTVYVNKGYGDFSGPLYDSIDAGDISWLSFIGDVDYALSFDGVDDYISFASAPNFPDTITIETWLYLNDGTGFQTIADFDFGAGGFATLQINNNRLHFSNDDGAMQSGFVTDTYVLPNQQWVHVAAVFTFGNTVQFYVNGQPTNSGGSAAVATGLSPTLTVGSSGGSSSFLNGTLDEFRIWLDDLSQSAIQSNQFATLTGGESMLYAAYDMQTIDPTEDTVLVDLTTNTYDGVLQNFNFSTTSGWVSSEAQLDPQLALNFGGSDERVEVTSGPQYNTNLTFEAWVRPEFTSGDFTIGSWDFAANDHATLQITNGELRYYTDNGTPTFISSFPPDTIATGDWTHVAFTKAGDDVVLYINAKEVASGTLATHPSGPTNFAIGGRENESIYLNLFDGDIDEVRIWDAVLDINTIRQYATTEELSSHPDILSLSARYDLNDGLLGGTDNMGYTAVIDKSSNGFDGTLGGTWGLSFASSNWVVSEALESGLIPRLYGNDIFIAGDSSNTTNLADGTDFGAVLEGDTVSNQFLLINEGFDTLVISSITNGLSEFHASTDKTVVLPLDSAELTVYFNPTSPSPFSDYIKIAYGEKSYDFEITGTGYPDESGPGYAITFNGSDQYVQLEEPGPFEFTEDDPVTIEAWIYPIDTTGFSTILSKEGITSGVEGFNFRLDNGKPELVLQGNIAGPNAIEVESTVSIDSGAWNHVAVTFDGSALASGVKFFINGDSVATNIVTDNISTFSIGNTEPAFIGGVNGASQAFNGRIDELRLWKVERTAEEINENYLGVIDPSDTTLGAYYRADFGIDSIVYDLTGNSNGEHFGTIGTFVFSHAPLNNEDQFETLFEKSAIWPGNLVATSANLQISEDAFISDDGDNVVFAHDNDAISDSDITTNNIFDSGGLISRRLERTWYIEFSDSTTLQTGGELDLLFDNVPAVDSTKTYYFMSRIEGFDDFLPVNYTSVVTLNDTVGITIVVDSLPDKAFFTLGISDAFPGNAIILDGVDDSLTITDAGYNDAFSFELWARINQPNPNQSPILQHGIGGDTVNVYIDSDSTLVADINYTGSRETIKSSLKINDDTWHHIAITRDNTNFKIYIDGVEDAGTTFINSTSAGTISAANWSGPMLLGRDNTGNATNISIDEFRIWQVARDSAQIAGNYLYPVNGINSDLEVYYRFDQFSGYTVPDQTGSNRPAILGGNIDFDFSTSGWITSTGFTSPTNQNTLSFDGSGDYVSVPNITNYDVADTTDFAIEAWVKGSGTNFDGAGIITMATNSPTFTGFSMIVYQGRLGVEIGDGASVQSPATDDLYGYTIIDDGDWHHVALSFNRAGQNVAFYVDGIQEFSMNSSLLGTDLTSGVFNIGTNYDLSNDFNGNIDEVRFWSTEKSDSDIQDYIYTRPLGSENHLEAYFNFDQGEAGADNSGISLLEDHSANFNDGTLNGFTLTGATSNFVESEIDSLRARVKVFGRDAAVLNFNDTINIGLSFLGDETFQQLTLANVGNDTLYISSITLGNAEYQFSQTLSDSTFNPFSTREIEVRVSPTAEPFAYSSFDITSNDPLSPFSGTLETTVYPNSPGSGNAISFNGSSSDYASSDGIAEGFDSFTVEFWASRTDTTSNDIAFSVGAGGANNLLSLGFQSGQTAIMGFGSDDLTTTYNSVSDWNHWAFTYDTASREQRILLNGVELASRTASANFQGSGTIFLGRNATGGDDYLGELDELRVWGYALPDSIIREHLASKITGQSANLDSLMVYYRMDESSATDIQDLIEGFDFTLFGATKVTSGAYLGGKSKYNYTSNEIDISPDAPIRVANVSNFTEGFHAYMIEQTPELDSLTGFQNIVDTVYYGVFAPGSTFDIDFQYTPDSGEDSLRIVRRLNNADPTWVGASSIFDLNTANDSIFVTNQTSGEFAYSKLNYPIFTTAGDALIFDGTNEYVDIPHDDRLNIAEGDFTIEAWVYPDTTEAETIISKGHGSGGANPDVFIFQIQANKIGLEFSDGASIEWGFSTSDVAQNQWSHVAVSYVSATRTATFYINGSQDGQHVYSLTPSNNNDTNSAFVGKQGYGCDCNYLNGQIDELRIWNSTLGTDTIASYAFQLVDDIHPNINDLVLYQKFDDGIGSTTLHDLESNLSGTLTNMESASDWVASGAFAVPAYTVINTNDTGVGSLRAVLDSANANAGLDTIKFDIPGSGPWIITLQSSLTSSDSIYVDGTSQPGWDLSTGMVVEIHDSTASFNGLEVVTSYFEVYGLRFNGLSSGIIINSNTDGFQIGGLGSENIFINNLVGIQGISGSNGLIESNYIGLDYDSLAGANSTGIEFNGTSTANTIGGSAAPNIISNNTTGIVFDGSGTLQNQVDVNTIFCNTTGISLSNGAHNSVVAPTIDSVDVNNVYGTGITGDSIDLYMANDSCTSDQGITYLGSTTVAAGNWTVSGLSLTLGDSLTAISYNATDGSSAFSVVFGYGEAPDAPTVDSLIANTLEPTITGTYIFGTDLDVTIDGTNYILGTDANLTTDSISTWSLDLAGFAVSGDGVYDVVATSTDTLTLLSSVDTTSNEITIDTTAPTIPTIDSLLTNNANPIIQGTSDIGDSLDVTVNSITYVLGADPELTHDSTAIWTLDLSSATSLTEGVYEVVANTSDLAGNVSTDASTNELEIDLTAPVTSIDTLYTNVVSPQLTGGIDDTGATVDVNVDGSSYTATNNGDGTWTLTAGTISPDLAEGTFEVLVTATDSAGNIANDASSNELTIDTTAPGVPETDTLITNNQTPIVIGTYEQGASLDITIDGVTYVLDTDPELTSDGSGNWTLDLSGGASIAEGVYDVAINSSDSAGNVTTDVQTNEVTIDITAPVVTVDALTTADLTPELTGTVDDNDADIDVTVDGNNYIANNNQDGTWTLPDNTITPDLGGGAFDVVVNATDKATNVGTDATVDELLVNAVPTAEAATNINAFDFTANWNNFTGIAGYVLEVATDISFTQFVSGYENFATTDSTEVVTGLNYGTTYYYRLRTVIAVGDTSAYSNPITVNTIILSGTTADSTALVRIYDNMDGANWNRNTDWTTSRLEFWENVTLVSGRVTALDLSSNNLSGDFPTFSGEELDQLLTLLLNDNAIDSVADITNLPLTDLQVQDNNLGFGSIEIIAAIPGTYSPQDSLLTELNIIENEGDNITLDRTASGTSNTYQWFKDGSIIPGETNATLGLTGISFGDEGEYYVEVENTIASGITLISNTINLKVSSLERDTTALRIIYNALDGDNWTDNNNWFSGDITTWDRIGSDGSRVTSIDLSNNNLGGTGIMPDEILDIINVTSIDLSDNRTENRDGLLEIPDFSSMPNLSTLDVSGNSLQFGSIEPTVGNVTTFLYDNQAQVGDGTSYSVPKGTTIDLSVTVSGDNNTYQWRRNGSNISGATNSSYSVVDIDYNNMGTYDVLVNNSVATALQIQSKENFTEAHVDIDGTVLGNGNPLDEGVIYALKIEPDQVAFDTVDTQDIVNGSFLFDDLVLGDYVIAAEGDTSEFLPTYYISSFLWAEADTLFLRDTINGFQIDMQAVPGEPDETGDGGLGGYLEDELGEEEGRLEGGRRVKRAGVMLRRRPPDSRPEDDEGFELFAYVQTDDNGEFTFENLPPGTYRINFEYPGVPMDLSSFVEFELGADGSSDSFSIVATVTEDGIIVVPVDITRILLEYFKDLTIYPNPSRNQLYLRYGRLNSENVIFNIYDVAGSLVMSQELFKGVDQIVEIDVSNLESGVYIINLTDRVTGLNITNARIIKE